MCLHRILFYLLSNLSFRFVSHHILLTIIRIFSTFKFRSPAFVTFPIEHSRKTATDFLSPDQPFSIWCKPSSSRSACRTQTSFSSRVSFCKMPVDQFRFTFDNNTCVFYQTEMKKALLCHARIVSFTKLNIFFTSPKRLFFCNTYVRFKRKDNNRFTKIIEE